MISGGKTNMESLYSGEERRRRVDVTIDLPRVAQIETRQTALIGELQSVQTQVSAMQSELSENTIVTRQVKELLDAPATFWAWCARWGQRIRTVAGWTRAAAVWLTPVMAAVIVMHQLLDIDVVALAKKIFFFWRKP